MAVEEGPEWGSVETALLRCMETSSLQPLQDTLLASTRPLDTSTWPERAARALEVSYPELCQCQSLGSMSSHHVPLWILLRTSQLVFCSPESAWQMKEVIQTGDATRIRRVYHFSDSAVESPIHSLLPPGAVSHSLLCLLQDCFMKSVITEFRRGIQEARASSTPQRHGALLGALAPLLRARCTALGSLLCILKILGHEVPDSLARLAGPHSASLLAFDFTLGHSSEALRPLQKRAEAAASGASRLAVRLDAMTVNAALAEDMSGLLLQYADQRLQHFTKRMARHQNSSSTAKLSAVTAELLSYFEALNRSTDTTCVEAPGSTNASTASASASMAKGSQGQYPDHVDASDWRPFWIQHSEHVRDFFDDEDEEEEEEDEGGEEGGGEEGVDRMSLGPDSMEDHENLDPGREGFRQPGEVKTPVRGSPAGAKGGVKSWEGARDTPRKRLDETALMETSLIEKATSGLRRILERRMGPVGSTRVLEEVGTIWVLETWVASQALGLVGLGELFSFGYAASVLVSLRSVVQRVCEGQMDRRALQQARLWNKALLLPFLSLVHPTAHSAAHWVVHHGTEEASHLQSLQGWRLRLEIFACKAVLRVRTGQLFAIVLDFPDSQPAVDDLRECLEATGDKHLVVAAYSEALSARLLTAGASTADILQQYVSTIRALRTLDPSGEWLFSGRVPWLLQAAYSSDVWSAPFPLNHPVG